MELYYDYDKESIKYNKDKFTKQNCHSIDIKIEWIVEDDDAIRSIKSNGIDVEKKLYNFEQN